MLQKIIAVFAIFIVLLTPNIASATHTPLGREGRASFVPEDSVVTMVSYNAYLRIRAGFTSVSLSMAIRNDSAEDVEFLMGMPTEYDAFSVVENLSVTVAGETQRIWIRRNTADIPDSWYAWTILLKPGETRIVDSTFSIGNKRTPLGGEVITFPLTYLGAWRGSVTSLKVIADVDFHGAYAFQPPPSVSPVEYARGGRLTFVLDGFDLPGNDITLHLIPISTVVPNYIASKLPDNAEIDTILRSFRNRDLDALIPLIDIFLEANAPFQYANELSFLQALAYVDLGRLDSALEIYDRLEIAPGFDTDNSIATAVRQKIIYDKAMMLVQAGNEPDALAYLSMIQPVVTDDVFALWLKNEITRLTPPPPPPPEIELPPPVEEPIIEEPPVEEEFHYTDIPPEMLAIIALLLILILYLIFRKKRKKRKYYFK